MAERTTGVRSVLSRPGAYALVQRLLGSARGSSRFVSEQVRPQSGDRLLDLGCGPGRLLADLPDLDYVGFDPSAAYITAARERFGDRGEFIRGTVADLDSSQIGLFDIAVARGVLHHLDDAQAAELVAFARLVLRPGGRLVTIDPAYVPDQRWISRQLVSRDRGVNVRTVNGYASLIFREFSDVAETRFSDLLNVPYDHASFVATRPPEASV